MGCGSLIGAALSLAGAGAQEVAASKTKGEMNDVLDSQQAQNKKLQQQGQGLFQQSFAQSTPEAAKNQIAQGQSQYLNAAQQAQAVPLGASTQALSSTDNQASQARAGLGNQALAGLAGYSNYGVQQGLKDQDIGSQLGAINNQASFNQSMLPGELSAAQNDFSSLRGIGSLLGTAGMLTGLGSQVGMFGGGGQAVPALGGSAPSPMGFQNPYLDYNQLLQQFGAPDFNQFKGVN